MQQKEDEIQNLQKQISMLEGDLDQVQTQLGEATYKLDTTEKQLSVVRLDKLYKRIYSTVALVVHISNIASRVV